MSIETTIVSDCTVNYAAVSYPHVTNRHPASDIYNSTPVNSFYRAMHFSAKRVIEIAYRLSVCPSVTIRYRDHIGWNSSKIISRPNSLGPV